jgi:hypothetical protein
LRKAKVREINGVWFVAFRIFETLLPFIEIDAFLESSKGTQAVC